MLWLSPNEMGAPLWVKPDGYRPLSSPLNLRRKLTRWHSALDRLRVQAWGQGDDSNISYHKPETRTYKLVYMSPVLILKVIASAVRHASTVGTFQTVPSTHPPLHLPSQPRPSPPTSQGYTQKADTPPQLTRPSQKRFSKGQTSAPRPRSEPAIERHSLDTGGRSDRARGMWCRL